MPANARPIIVFSILVVTSGCDLFSRVTGDEVIYAPTAVGMPVGDKVTKDIGSSGGSLSSPDGRLTLTVPPNAVTGNAAFSIQPINNKAEDGVGPAYRLEPSGKIFNVPVLISVKYSEQDVEGTYPQALKLAYQDEKGAWHEQSSTSLDTANQRVTVSTTHLSDWSFYMGEYIRISPAKADLRVGESVVISVRRCTFNYWAKWALFGAKKVCEEIGSSSDNPGAWKLKGPGTLKGESWPRVIYTAPARQPKPNVVTVVYNAAPFPEDIADLEAKIRIIGRGYRASGTSGGMTFSGVICSLDHPFTINGQTQYWGLKFDFKPTSGTAGTVATGGGGTGMTVRGSGTYAIEGADTDKPRIALTLDGTGSVPGVGSADGSGTRYVGLVPFDTDECGAAPPPPTPGPTAPPQLRGKGPF